MKSEMFTLILKNLRDCAVYHPFRIEVPVTRYHRVDIVLNRESSTIDFVDLIKFLKDGSTESYAIYCRSCPQKGDLDKFSDRQIQIIHNLVFNKFKNRPENEIEIAFNRLFKD